MRIRRSTKGKLLEVPLLLIVALGISFLIKTFLMQAFYIPSGSMENTLHVGDRVSVNRLGTITGNGIQRGDVVVFHDSAGWLGSDGTPKGSGAIHLFKTLLTDVGVLPDSSKKFLIKRVIGMPGDHVVCCTTKRNLTVNGHELDESSYIYAGNKPSEVAFNVVVPSERIWVMGDHRGNSGDSRFHRDDQNNGFVPVNEVVGRAIFLLWPLSRTSVLKRPAGLERANP
ncbi:MAG TPA: signal peptidase I [Candidatus Paceibacterota bacterium]|nr:signal peptidase I [Candidatus Paceibacterota bacterium]